MAVPSGSAQPVNDAPRLLRELLFESDNDILVALRDFTPSEMARLSDLIGSRIFDVCWQHVRSGHPHPANAG